MKARAAHIMPTIDMPYSPRDLVANFKSYTISEWRWFLEYSPVLFEPYIVGGQQVSCIGPAGPLCILSAMQPVSASACSGYLPSRLWPSYVSAGDAPAGHLSLHCLHKRDGRWSLALQVEVLHTPQLRTLWSHLRPAFLHYTTDMDGANFVSRNQEVAH